MATKVGLCKQSNEVRIIGGKWRSRKICFSAHTELRPTLNCIRETLFNWLAPFVVDSICLDLFAGSGALGFEALSRGAKHVVMMDKSKYTVVALKNNAKILQIEENITFIQKAFSPNLTNLSPYKFAIVFLDPPFKSNLAEDCCNWLEQNDCLAERALIYLETAKNSLKTGIPTNWEIYRQKTEGQVSYFLFRRKSIIE